MGSRQVRIRKLNRSAGQQVLREDQIDSTEYDSLQGQSKVETGVEKSEESEYHLQAALAATSGSGERDAPQEIPAPPAQESSDIDYDSLYSLILPKPATYIRFSQTVDECTGCQYDMTTEDDVFLKAFNQKKPAASKCSEDDFERIMDVLEETAKEQAPFAAIDNTVVPFDSMALALKQQIGERILVFAKDIYEHWKACRQTSGNKPLQPDLKIEKNQDRDDGDPYVCFRRRDPRQTRKTRNRDVQSTEKLKKLRKELEDGRHLIEMAYEREVTKGNLLRVDRSIFEQRAKVKDVKIKLGIKSDDDDLLINQKQPPKRKFNDMMQQPPQNRHQSGSQMRVPSRSDGRPLDAELVFLEDLLVQKENMIRLEMEDKARQHRKWNSGHVDLTREPLSPVHGQGPETGFRPATAQYHYLMTPPSSVTSESFDPQSPSQETQEKSEPLSFRYSSPPEEEEPRGQPAYRRRIGRCGRLWIDRRGMSSKIRSVDEGTDRWKYDNDDDDEQPVYEMDPYDTKALRFRATIPFPNHLLPQRIQQGDRPSQVARPNGVSPTQNRTLPAAASQQSQVSN